MPLPYSVWAGALDLNLEKSGLRAKVDQWLRNTHGAVKPYEVTQ